MVGMTIVAHSITLAETISNLISEQTSFKLRPACAVNSDLELIKRAVESVTSPHGVLVLVDSAKSAEAVQAVFGEASHIRLCPAPLVEGAREAADIITEGANLDEAYFYAMRALTGKHTALAPADEARKDSVIFSRYKFQMKLPRGMHASCAAELVSTLADFDSDVLIANITRLKPPVSARSVNKIAVSNIRYGDEVEILARGEDAAAAADAVKRLVDNNFNRIDGEERIENASPLTTLSMGIAVGTVYCADSFVKDIKPVCVLDPEKEIERLKLAIKEAGQSLKVSKERLMERGLKEEAAIFDAHRLILEDSEVFEDVSTQIKLKRMGAEYVYQQKMLALADEFRNIDDIYMKERATDVLDVAKQVLSKLTGTEEPDMSQYRSVIVAANEVTPSMLGKISPERLKGVLTNHGSAFSHVAILARALGIPAVAGYRLPPEISNGSKIVMDASIPEVTLNPNETVLNSFRTKYTLWNDELEQNLEYGRGPAVTADGYEVPVLGNVGSIATAEAVQKNGAGGIGLLRTEFLYLNRREKPTEKEQMQILKDIFGMFGSSPIVVRTLDIGGDKHIPWLPLKKANNPYMGVRGVRVYSLKEELFYNHLCAILKAADGHDIRIVVPMVSMAEEMDYVRDILNSAHFNLLDKNIPHGWPVPLGVMVETPAAVLMADELARKADFFSIGTNDLSQYIMAAERGEKSTEHLLNPMQPALLKAIKMTVDAAHSNNIEVSVCGEMAGDPEFAKILLGLGVDCLSMNASMIGVVKRMVREATADEMRRLAERAVRTEILHQIKD